MIENNDKEMDGLLRALAKGGPERAPSSADHMDADEISVFAENALPEKARARVVSHLADCARCRTILSNVVSARAQNTPESEAESAAGTAVSLGIPWYRKLFAVRNLATALGVLVVLFAGLFAVFLLRNLGGSGDQVAQLENANTASPEVPAAEEMAAGEDSANTAAPLANSDAPEPKATPLSATTASDEIQRQNEVRRGDIAAADADDGTVLRRPSDVPLKKGAGRSLGQLAAKPKVAMKDAAPQPAAPAPAAAPPPPPVAAQESVAERTETDRVRDKAQNAAASGASAEREAKADASGRKEIQGKVFNLRGKVWYDAAYSGQPTTNVRRKTPAYRSLDAGLRSIADNLSGTVVVVWNKKAYRID